jgi:hypothetical protein
MQNRERWRADAGRILGDSLNLGLLTASRHYCQAVFLR